MTLPETKSEGASVAIGELLPSQSPSPRKHLGFESIFSERLPFARLHAWAIRGGASILQQGLFAGSHFLANVLLARWMAPGSYGAFALAYSFFLLLLSLYMALFYEPLLVYGSGRYGSLFSPYVRILIRGHFLFLLPVSLLIVFVAPVIGRFYTHEFQIAFVSLAAVSPFLLLVWLFRAVYYARLDPYAGTVAGACYFALLLLSIWSLREFGILSPATALGAIGASSFLVCAGCMYNVRDWGQPQSNLPGEMTSRVVSDHWRYGRWAAFTAMATWIPANIYYALLPARFGLEGTALLRAIMNLMSPLLHSFSALLTLLIPILVRQRERGGLHRSKRTTLQLIAMYIPVGVLFLLAVTTLRAPILRLLYGGRYSSVSVWVVLCVATLPITTGVVGLFGSALRSFERPHLAFFGYLPSTITAVAVGVPLTLHYGVSGAASGLVLSDLSAIVVLSICFAGCKEAGGTAV
jgi:O-antigen/teichoic acid export membrane protein